MSKTAVYIDIITSPLESKYNRHVVKLMPRFKIQLSSAKAKILRST